jgi:hypothetical protein
MTINISKLEKTDQTAKDLRINELHEEALSMWSKVENIIDELKLIGPHSRDGNNALLNTRDWLEQLSKR